MSYVKTSWVARVGTALNRFLKTNETSTEVELTNDPTGVTIAGTPFTVANMNKIEDGIYDAHVGLDNNGLIDNTRINQDVRTTASPTFANATISGHIIDSELDTLNGRVNQGVKTTDSPTFAKLTLTTSTYGTQDIAGNGSWVFPVGIYQISRSGGITDTTIQVYNGSEWVGSGDFGAVISDGSNVRIYNSHSTQPRIVHYRKFS